MCTGADPGFLKRGFICRKGRIRFADLKYPMKTKNFGLIAIKLCYHMLFYNIGYAQVNSYKITLTYLLFMVQIVIKM